MSVTMLPLDILVQRCTDENSKYIRREPTNDTYMFELLRRALVLNNTEALGHVQRLFERRLLSWVHKHDLFTQTGECAEFLSNKAFSNFCVAMGNGKLANFHTFSALMAYLKKCVNTAIIEEIRKQPYGPTRSLDSIAERSHIPDLNEHVNEQEVLNRIYQLITDPHNRVLVRFNFIYGMPPREILNQPGVPWADEREISVQLYRIRSILRNDSDLRERFGL